MTDTHHIYSYNPAAPPGAARWLPFRQATIMDILWTCYPRWKPIAWIASAPDHEHLAYTTITTTVYRLIDAGLVERSSLSRRPGRLLRVRATESFETFQDRQIAAILESLDKQSAPGVY